MAKNSLPSEPVRGALTHIPRTIRILAALILSLGLTGGCNRAPQHDARRHLQEAERAQAQGRLGDAVVEIKNALQSMPEDAGLRLRLARLYLKLGLGAPAEKEFRMVLKSSRVPERDLAWELTRAQILEGRYEDLISDKVEETLRRVKSLGLPAARQARLLSEYGTAYLMAGRRKDSRLLYERALQLDPGDADAQLGEITLDAASKGPEQTKGRLARLLAKYPRLAAAWSLLGDLERTSQDLEAAEKAYTKAIDLRLAQAHDLYGRFLVRLARNDLQGAKQDLDKFRPYAPHSAKVKYLEGLMAYRKADFEKALERFLAALGIDKHHLPSLYFAGLAAAQLGLEQQANAYLSAYYQRRPQEIVAARLLTSLRIKQGDYIGAQKVLNAALRYAPDDKDLREMMAITQLQTGHPDKAVTYYKALLTETGDKGLAYLKLGLGLLAQGKTDAAAEALSRASRNKLQDLQTGLVLAQSLARSGELADALVQTRDLEARFPDDRRPRRLKAEILLAQGRKKEARALLERLAETQPDDYATAFALARIALQDADLEAASRAYERVLKADPENYKALLALADLAIRAKDPERARRFLVEARKRHPEAWAPRVLLARHYLAKGRLEQAKKEFGDLAKRFPRIPEVQETAGRIALREGKPNEAIDKFRTALLTGPESAQIYFELAQAQAAAGITGEAIKSLRKTLKLKPTFTGARIVLARILLTQGGAKQAQHILAPIQGDATQNTEVLILKGDIAVRQNRYEDARKAYRAAFEQQPSGTLAARLAATEIYLKRPEKGAKLLADWIEAHPGDIQNQRRFAHLIFGLGLKNQARPLYEALVKDGNADAQTYNNLALLVMDEEPAKGLEYANKALTLAPNTPLLLDNLGLAYLRNGKPSQALGQFRRAVQLRPKNPEFQWHLAFALAQTGATTEAMKLLTHLKDNGRGFEHQKEAGNLLRRLRLQAVETR